MLRAGYHSTAQAALPGAGWAVEQADGQPGMSGGPGEYLRCFIVTIVDNQEFGVRRIKGQGQLPQQWPDVEFLIASWDDDGQASRRCLTGGLIEVSHSEIV
jgi:hypothetical protein